MDLLLEIFVLSVGFCFAVYAYFSWKLNYFSRKKIPSIKAYPIVGSIAPILFRQVANTTFVCNIYNALKGHRFGGMLEFHTPVLVVRDPELLKQILVKDFDHFVDRRALTSEEADELFGKSVFSLQGHRWRDMRNTLSPAFTGSKMKNMFLLVSDCGQQLCDYLEKRTQEHEAETRDMLSLEMKDFFTRYTNDVIATTAFGVQCDSLRNPTNEFYKVGKKVTDFSGVRGLIVFGYMISTRFMKFLGISMFDVSAKNFLRSLVKDTVTTREREGIVRPDMIHLLMQARKGELKAEAGEEEATNGLQKTTKTDLSDEDITAQALVFFLAGFETTSTLLSFLTYHLALHPDIQQRLQEEVDSVLESTGDKLTYECLQKMRYMDMVISETLRLYPSVDSLDRKCVSTYTIPATDTSPEVTLNNGDGIFVPVFALHRDPEYFPDPEKFNPERFSDDNKHNIQPYTYMPFGMGPRNCIGMRFALMEVKAVLAHVLARFSFNVVSRTEVPLVLSKSNFNLMTDAGIWLGIKGREKTIN